MPLPLLIGGSPTAGKSSVAAQLVSDPSLVGEIDLLKEDFKNQKTDQRHHYPWLFSNYKVSAEDFWKDKHPADLIKHEIAEAREFWPELKRLIESGKYRILEGVSILPELVWKEYAHRIQFVLLIDSQRDRVKQTVMTRGVWDEADTYADWIKPLEVEWVMLHNKWFQEQAKKYPYPLIEVGDRTHVLQQVKQVLQ